MNGPARSWPAVLTDLMAGRELAPDDTAWAMDEIMSGNATPAQLAAFAVLLRAKGETPGELAGMVRAMLEHAAPLVVDGPAVDVVGTGADRAHTVNISTMAALTVAGSGRRVVKHGGRAASSACGTADVLEELGVAIDLPPDGVRRSVDEVGIGFCFAPVFHAGMRHAGGPRRELGVPTAFNFLGPLTNPARVTAAAVGCADLRMAPVMAAVLAGRGDTAIVFRGDDGLDELTTTTTSSAWVAAGGEVEPATVDPTALGIEPVEPAALRGGDRAFNAAVVRDVLAGGGPGVRDAVLLNAAAAIAAFDGRREAAGAGTGNGADGTGNGLAAGRLHDALARGLRIAAETIDSGAAADLLGRWIAASRTAAT
ncbi:anthranilate phosphoribosyltransferase [uncultured Jatrophihabitans sp.]|uniref:anthranilate phosphoribosyltransferase n=1 Tax=uncultured Jatrophihabitans sp. TaxID=1610747 RepID=UPI0035CC8D1D